jgi:hypothetical protein
VARVAVGASAGLVAVGDVAARAVAGSGAAVIVLVTTCDACPLARRTEIDDRCGHPLAPRDARLDLDHERQEWCPLKFYAVTVRGVEWSAKDRHDPR